MTHGLSTAEIAKTMTCVMATRNLQDHFLCVFPFDQFPVASFLYASSSLNSVNTPALCTIINTDPSTSPGQHWVAFFKGPNSDPKEIEFFDSYGQNPLTYGFHFPTEIRVLSNSFPLQSLSTIVCGHYCILFLYLRSTNLLHCTLDNVIIKLHSLARTSILRDHQVQSFVTKLASACRQRNSQVHSSCPNFLLSNALDLAATLVQSHQTSNSYAFRHAYLVEHPDHSSLPISENL